jgi:hypothetical protein
VDLERYLNREPVAARPRTLVYRGHKFLARHRLIALGVVATVVGALCAALLLAHETA